MQKKNKFSRSGNRNNQPQRRKYCYFCSNNIAEIDYQDINVLQKFTSNYQKILPRSRMGSCARHQRQLQAAVKRARYMALIPYLNNHK